MTFISTRVMKNSVPCNEMQKCLVLFQRIQNLRAPEASDLDRKGKLRTRTGLRSCLVQWNQKDVIVERVGVTHGCPLGWKTCLPVSHPRKTREVH
jgi:hypothetical protein